MGRFIKSFLALVLVLGIIGCNSTLEIDPKTRDEINLTQDETPDEKNDQDIDASDKNNLMGNLSYSSIDETQIPEIVFQEVPPPKQEVFLTDFPKDLEDEYVLLWISGNMYSDFSNNYFTKNGRLLVTKDISIGPGFFEKRPYEINMKSGEYLDVKESNPISFTNSKNRNLREFELQNSTLYYINKGLFFQHIPGSSEDYMYLDNRDETKLYASFIIYISEKDDEAILLGGNGIVAIKLSEYKVLWDYYLTYDKYQIHDVLHNNNKLIINYYNQDEYKEVYPISYQTIVNSRNPECAIGNNKLKLSGNYLQYIDRKGNQIWDYNDFLGSNGYAQVVLKDDKLFLRNSNREIACINLIDGKKIWETSGLEFSSFKVLDTTLISMRYVENDTAILQSIDQQTGVINNIGCEFYHRGKTDILDTYISDDFLLIGNSVCFVKKDSCKVVIIPDKNVIFPWLSDMPFSMAEFWDYESEDTFSIINNTDEEVEFNLFTEDEKYNVSESNFTLLPDETRFVTVTQNLLTKTTPINEEYDWYNNEIREKYKLKPLVIEWGDNSESINVAFGEPFEIGD